jgi:hypothetical protein
MRALIEKGMLAEAHPSTGRRLFGRRRAELATDSVSRLLSMPDLARRSASRPVA